MVSCRSSKVISFVTWKRRQISGSLLSRLIRSVKVFWSLDTCTTVSYTHLRAHETPEHLVCRLLLEKNKILTALKNRITSEGEIVIISQSERSQLMNRRKAEEKFFNLLAKILTPVPERKSTSPTQASKLKRIDGKRKRSAKKRLRNEKGLGEERD